MITHIVFFKMQDCTEENLTELQDCLLGMDGKINELVQIEVGIDIARSGRAWDLALLTRFDSRDELDAYRDHPVHQEVLKTVRVLTSESAVVDYES